MFLHLSVILFTEVGSLSGGGSLSRGVSLSRGRGFCQGDPPFPRAVTCGRYASYWNAFLCSIKFVRLSSRCNGTRCKWDPVYTCTPFIVSIYASAASPVFCANSFLSHFPKFRINQVSCVIFYLRYNQGQHTAPRQNPQLRAEHQLPDQRNCRSISPIC